MICGILPCLWVHGSLSHICRAISIPRLIWPREFWMRRPSGNWTPVCSELCVGCTLFPLPLISLPPDSTPSWGSMSLLLLTLTAFMLMPSLSPGQKLVIFSHRLFFSIGSCKKLSKTRLQLWWSFRFGLPTLVHHNVAFGNRPPNSPPSSSPISLPWNQDLCHPNSDPMRLISVTLSGNASVCKTLVNRLLQTSFHHLQKVPCPATGEFT